MEKRARGHDWRIGVVSALVLFVAGAVPASGQVTAAPEQDLAFGMLMPGTWTTVLVNDAVRRAQWVLSGRGTVTISFILPSALLGSGGTTLPVLFASGDAGYMRQSGAGGMNLADPNAPFSVNVPNRQPVDLFLGGTAQPATTQSAGTYSATITVIIAQP